MRLLLETGKADATIRSRCGGPLENGHENRLCGHFNFKQKQNKQTLIQIELAAESCQAGKVFYRWQPFSSSLPKGVQFAPKPFLPEALSDVQNHPSHSSAEVTSRYLNPTKMASTRRTSSDRADEHASVAQHGQPNEPIELRNGASTIAIDGDRQEFSLPPADGGKDAWLFLITCFFVEAFVWGFPFSYGIFEDYYSTHEPFVGKSGIPAVGSSAMVSLPVAFFNHYSKYTNPSRALCTWALHSSS